MPLSSIVKFLNCLISPGSERDCRLYGGLPEAPAVLGIASTGYRPHSTLGRKQSGQATGPHKSSKSTRPCLKNVKTPKRRIFFRRFALIFLAIHRVWRRQIALTGKKISRRCVFCHLSKQGLGIRNDFPISRRLPGRPICREFCWLQSYEQDKTVQPGGRSWTKEVMRTGAWG